MVAGRPAQHDDQDPGDPGRACPAITDVHRRGHQRQRHADLLPGPLPAVMDASWPAWSRPRPTAARPVDDPVGRVVLRLPRRHRDRQAARQDRHRRSQGAARARPAIANARLAYQALRGDLRLRPLAGPRGGRRQQAAPAVGLHRRQGPGLPRHPVRRRAGRARHGQHHAGGHDRGRRRPRRDPRRHHRGTYDEAAAVFDGARRRRRRPTTTSSSVLEDEGVEKFEDSWTTDRDASQGSSTQGKYGAAERRRPPPDRDGGP